MSQIRRILTLILAVPAISTVVDAAATPRANHHDGHRLLGGNLTTAGSRSIDKKGDNAIAVELKNGKIAGFRVTRAAGGNVPVRKVWSSKRMAKLQTAGLQTASFDLGHDPYLEMVYIGYAFLDESGEEHVYWFPVDMILDGEAGASEYVPGL